MSAGEKASHVPPHRDSRSSCNQDLSSALHCHGATRPFLRTRQSPTCPRWRRPDCHRRPARRHPDHQPLPARPRRDRLRADPGPPDRRVHPPPADRAPGFVARGTSGAAVRGAHRHHEPVLGRHLRGSPERQRPVPTDPGSLGGRGGPGRRVRELAGTGCGRCSGGWRTERKLCGIGVAYAGPGRLPPPSQPRNPSYGLMAARLLDGGNPSRRIFRVKSWPGRYRP